MKTSMLSLRLARITSTQLPPSNWFHKFSPVLFSNSEHEDPADRKNEIITKSKQNEEAIKKLNLLLKSMTEKEHVVQSSGIGAQFTRPPVKPKKDPVEKVKEVAEVIGGDVKEIESELLNKLLASSQTVNNDMEEKQTPQMNLRDLLSGMKIDRSKRPDIASEEGRAKRVRRILEGHRMVIAKEQDLSFEDVAREQQGPRLYASKIDLFGGETLGIFKKSAEGVEISSSDSVDLKTWNRLVARELRLAVTHPPTNIFEECILWTEQGKLWNFPINNEQGQVEESKVSFTQHVFLEHHLDPWCPKRGPVRHFMELVCVGLSKNPYITAQMKLEHINWFHNYFKEKNQILLETGAITAPSDNENSVDKSTHL